LCYVPWQERQGEWTRSGSAEGNSDGPDGAESKGRREVSVGARGQRHPWRHYRICPWDKGYAGLGNLFWHTSQGHEGEVQLRVANLTNYIESMQTE